MKKRVTFAENQTVHRLQQDETLSRDTGVNGSKIALKDARMNFNKGLNISKPPADRCEQVTMVQIPRTMSAAPFLQHTALTPAQREYLYTVAASYSPAHVRDLIMQHYMNVLHRCIRTGCNPEGDDVAGTSVASPGSDENNKQPAQVPSGAKHKEKINTRARNAGKSHPPKRSSLSTSASTQRKMNKHRTTSPKLKTKSPPRAEEEEEEEGGLDDSLSDCLSSLSVAEWDDHTSSDL